MFAGKAHPADDLGKEMIAQIVRFSRDPAVRHRFTFVEDYDISVARTLYQGSDVWLNTPRRPMEASGTSGEKAALNGALNCSILDGWWDEMFDGDNGWAISSAEAITDLEHRDEVEANSLFELLERQIIPLFYDRGGGSFPRGWVTRIKASLRSLGPKVMASRMVRDYLSEMYEPIAAQSDALAADGHARARELAAWKKRVTAAWPEVKVEVDPDPVVGLVDLGAEREVTARGPSRVVVARRRGGRVAARAGRGRRRAGRRPRWCAWSGDGTRGPATPAGVVRYRGRFSADQAGRHGYAVRVVPAHRDLVPVSWAA